MITEGGLGDQALDQGGENRVALAGVQRSGRRGLRPGRVAVGAAGNRPGRAEPQPGPARGLDQAGRGGVDLGPADFPGQRQEQELRPFVGFKMRAC